MNLRQRYRLLVLTGSIALACWTAMAIAENQSQIVPTDQGEATTGSAQAKEADGEPYIPKTKRELQRMLTRIQYDVTQNEATEPAFRNRYWDNKKEGIYKCVVCGRDLFSSKTKYKSGTGWPSFYAPINPKSIGTRTDYRLFYARTEVHCSRCKAHLGHVFDDGPKPTGLRYCMNSASLKFVEKSESSDKDSEK
jgi:methionine-R-sulfoxide reductase